jgi:hypothetical protein
VVARDFSGKMNDEGKVAAVATNIIKPIFTSPSGKAHPHRIIEE